MTKMMNKGMGKKSMSKSARGGFGASAGGKKMAGFSGAATSEAGKTSVGGRAGNKKFAADTGKGRMAGYTGAQNAKKA